jgi:hypothetical protein
MNGGLPSLSPAAWKLPVKLKPVGALGRVVVKR